MDDEPGFRFFQLKQGYWNNNVEKHETHTALTMCLLPEGMVVVWLSGQNQVVLGR